MAQTKIRSEQIEDNLNQDFDTESWNAITLLNNWENYPGSFADASYFKDSLGIVHLQGLIADGDDGEYIGTLPVGYRPSYVMIFPVVKDATGDSAELRVDTNGNCLIRNSSSSWTSLNGVAFMV